MQRFETELPGVWVLDPAVYGDARGFFFESYHALRFRALGLPQVWVQENHSQSGRGTLRGLHYQLDHPQAKLCRVVRGEALDVAVDIRRGSPHFGKWTAVRLSEDNKRQVFVPRGFAHGFLALSERVDFLYRCDEVYYPEDQRGIAWNDPLIGIEWGIEAPLLSEKDHRCPYLAELPEELLPVYEPERSA
jgi:dTDP-4-dehydrorhamnose 3,5-epimerase